jgi:hypothetical protein
MKTYSQFHYVVYVSQHSYSHTEESEIIFPMTESTKNPSFGILLIKNGTVLNNSAHTGLGILLDFVLLQFYKNTRDEEVRSGIKYASPTLLKCSKLINTVYPADKFGSVCTK